MTEERVLCIPLSIMKNTFGLTDMCWTIDECTLNNLVYKFVNRQKVEDDNRYKQLIAYAVVINSNNEVLCYKRAGSEKRLSGSLSAAIGGHVNEDDYNHGNTLADILRNGLQREIYEEIGILIDKTKFELICMINEEESEVGHYHTGVVYCIRLNGKTLSFNKEILEPQWIKANNIDFNSYELWSSLAVKAVFDRINRRRVFISFLGTNNYVESMYDFGNGVISGPVRFIQEALILSTCKDWTENDRIFIFCTSEAEKKNWKDNGQERATEDIEKIGLESRLRENFPLFSIVEMKSIPDGFSETEIWEIFSRVYSEICDNDEIYFDVTHAFRSIPLFSTVLFNYSGFMKNSNLKSIMYGAFEKLGPQYKVKDMPIESRVAPIIDLTNVIRLQQFTDVASSFVSFGRLKKTSEVLSEYSNVNQSIGQLQKAIANFDEYLLSNQMSKIRKGAWYIAIKNAVKPLQRSAVPEPLKNVLGKIIEEFQDFVPEDSDKNIVAAINWAVKYEMVFTAYILGEEYIITKVSERYNDRNPFADMEFYGDKRLDKNDKNKYFREMVSAVCAMQDEDVEKKNYKNKLADFKEWTDGLLNEQFILDIRTNFVLLAKNRNSLGHAKGDTEDYRKMLSMFSHDFSGCLATLEKY